MNICISNLSWLATENQEIYHLLNKLGVHFLEIAPSIFTGSMYPYDVTPVEINLLQKNLRTFHLTIASMQSIHFGYNNLALFETIAQYEKLLDVSQQAIEFANMLHIPNIVFGSPKVRIIPQTMDQDMVDEIWFKFFSNLAQHAKNTTISLEPNSHAYGTNFATNTTDTIKIVRLINHPNFKLNLDMGTFILENEDVSLLANNFDIINHIHISCPFLKKIYSNPEYDIVYKQIITMAQQNNYKNMISIEMLKENDQDNSKHVENAIRFLKDLIGDENA